MISWSRLAAVALDGAKGVGKTETAERRASSLFTLDSRARRTIVQADPEVVLRTVPPVLVDEWQLDRPRSRVGAGDVPGVRDSTLLGHLFESLATLCVRVGAHAAEATTAHLRTRDGDHEVDLVVVREDGRILALELTLAAAVTGRDVRHLTWLRPPVGPPPGGAVPVLEHSCRLNTRTRPRRCASAQGGATYRIELTPRPPVPAEASKGS